MKKMIAATLFTIALATPAVAFDIGSIDGIPADVKDTIARQSGGRITNGQSQQQAGQGSQQQGRQARKKQSSQDKALQSVDQIMKGDTGTIGQGIGTLR